MRLVEVKKGDAEIKRGSVMMSIEGKLEEIEALSKKLDQNGWKENNSNCMDEIDDEVYAIYYVVDRSELSYFKKSYKEMK